MIQINEPDRSLKLTIAQISLLALRGLKHGWSYERLRQSYFVQNSLDETVTDQS